MLYLSVGEIDNLEATVDLSWVQDAISWNTKSIYRLRVLDYNHPTAELIAMPFLESPDSTDVQAIRAMDKLARNNSLSALVESSVYQEASLKVIRCWSPR